MEFCFLRASRSVVAQGTFALVLASPMGVSIAMAQDAPAGQAAGQAAGGQAPAKQKNYKDRAEYDLFSKITQTQDPKARLELLNTWQDKYPTSDYKHDRLIYFITTLNQLAPSDPAARQQLLEKCKVMLQEDPKSFEANYFTTTWGPSVGGANPSADLQTQIQNAAQAMITNADEYFSAARKPKNMDDAAWAKAKTTMLGLAHRDLAYVAVAKKDYKTAQNEYKESLTINPEQASVSYDFAKAMQSDAATPNEQKFPLILFEYARAAAYDGPGSLSASARPAVQAYFNKVYAQYHGSADGADQVLNQAKTAALPPAGFTIPSVNDLAKNQAAQMNQRIESDPAFKLWYSIQQQLIAPGGDQFWNQMKGAEVPGTQVEGVKNFSGTVISLSPPDKPTTVVLGVTDPTKPDATLVFSQPLSPDAVNALKVGTKVDFSGVADSYTANPYMLTFKDPSIPGVKTEETPASSKHRAAPRRSRK